MILEYIKVVTSTLSPCTCLSEWTELRVLCTRPAAVAQPSRQLLQRPPYHAVPDSGQFSRTHQPLGGRLAPSPSPASAIPASPTRHQRRACPPLGHLPRPSLPPLTPPNVPPPHQARLTFFIPIPPCHRGPLPPEPAPQHIPFPLYRRRSPAPLLVPPPAACRSTPLGDRR